MLKEIPNENANIRPFRTHKTYMHSSGSYPIYTVHSSSYADPLAHDPNTIPGGAFDLDTFFDPINESKSNGYYQRMIYKSLEAKLSLIHISEPTRPY